jgi:cell fate regulator YaaT (PSP1 superfamily)
VYYFDADRLPDVSVGEWVVVETSRGPEAGWVVIAPRQVLDANVANIKPVQRRVTAQELSHARQLQRREDDMLRLVRAEIEALGLSVRAVKAEYAFDGRSITVYYTTEEARLDSRLLVGRLARRIEARVDLRQIGSRDRAKLIDGLGRCGRRICCSAWMTDFVPISIGMAKNQGLSLNPSEISGICGKLLCCLAFEDEHYVAIREGLPKKGAWLTSAYGRGRVTDVDIEQATVTITWESGSVIQVPAAEFRELAERRRQVGLDR